MAEDEPKTLISLDDTIEGDCDSTGDFVFVRVGASVPLKPSNYAFDLQNPPSQPIAFSQPHRLLFSAHSQGFFVAKTEDVVGVAEAIKEKGKGPSVEEVSIVDVKISGVSILAVSGDGSTLSAAVDQEISFFSVLSLLNKGQEPSFSCSLNEPDIVKDFKWQKNMEKSFVVLSSHGSLYHGTIGAELKNVMENVDAVDWSAEGGFVAIARKHIITVLSSNFKEILNMSLLFESWPPTDSKCTIKVDSIKWLRDDTIIIGCFQLNTDGEEEGYLVQVIKSKEHNFSEFSYNPVVYSFPDLFDGDWDILPIGCGPYLLANYLDYWEIVLVSNQKAIDQHISLLKWSMGDSRREVVSLEFRSDKYTPKIEVPENGDDNLLLGFCLEKFSSMEKIKIQVDEKFKELSPRCILLCLTSEGKLNLFRVARISEPSDLLQTSIPLDDNDVFKEKHFTLSSSEDSTAKPRLKDDVEDATQTSIPLDGNDVFKEKHFTLSSSEDSTAKPRLQDDVEDATQTSIPLDDNDVFKEKQIGAEALNSHKDTFQLQRDAIYPQRKQVGDGSQVGLFTGQIGESKSSIEAPVVQRSGFTLRNDVTPGANVFSDSSAKMVEGTTSSIGKIASEAPAATHASPKGAVEHGEVGNRLFSSTCIGATQGATSSIGKIASEAPAAMHASTKGAVEHGEVVTRLFSSTSIGSNVFSDSSAKRVEGTTSLIGKIASEAPAATHESPKGAIEHGEVGNRLFSSTSIGATQGTTSLIGKIASEAPAAMHGITKGAVEHGEVGKRLFGSTSIGATPFVSQSTGKLFGADISPSTFTFSRSVLSDAQDKTKLNSVSSEFQFSDQLFSSKVSNIEPRSSMFSSSKPTQSKGNSSSSPSTGNVELVPTVRGSQLLAPEVTLPGKLHYSRALPLLENIRASKFPQKLDSQPEISKQFYDVKDMTQELDILLSFIEKEGGFRDACTVFQRSSLLALENVLGDLSEISHKCRKDTEEQLMEIQQLQNKMLQVSARQGYMKGIVEQASNKKYWDIWNQQKLNPELEAKRQNILNANQNLTNQIIELERHFNTLEINRFGESGRSSIGHTAFKSGLVPARQKQSLQSVYNTLNLQLAAAEHLSEHLLKLMSELNINSASVKRQSITKELFESIGLSDEIASFQSPVCKRPSLVPDSVGRTPPSTTNAIKDHARKNTSSVAKAFEPETARRRRDSLDRNWATFEPPKTIVKRSMQVQCSGSSADNPFSKAKEKFDSQMEAFAIQQKGNATRVSSSSQYLLDDGMRDSQPKQVIEAQSNSGSKWVKDISGLPHILGSKSYPEVATERISTLPTSMSPLLSAKNSSQSSTRGLLGSPDMSSIKATQLGYQSNPLAAKTVTSSSSTFPSPISPMDTRQIVQAKDQAKNSNLTRRGTALAFTMPGSTKHLADSSESVSSITNESNISSFSTIHAFTSAGLNGKATGFNETTTWNQSNTSLLNLESFPKASVPTSSPLPFSSSATPATASTTSLTPASLTSISFGKSSLSTKPEGVTNQTASVSTSTSAASNQSLPSSGPTQSQTSVIQMNTTLMPNSSPAKLFEASFTDTKSGASSEVASVSTSIGPSSHSLSSSSNLFSQSEKSSSTIFTSLSTASRSPTITDPTPPVTSATVCSAHLDKVDSKSQPATKQTSASGEVESVPKNENNLLSTSSGSTSVATSLSQLETSSSTSLLNRTTEKDEQLDVSLSQEDEMEEEAPDMTTMLGSPGGFGLGSTPSSSAPKPNPFGDSFLTANSSTARPPLTLTASSGEPFRPASFSLPSAQSVQTSQPPSSGGFSSGMGGGFSGFGQSSQVGVGQQALGSVLGSFGQSRQLGSGMPGVGFPSSSGFSGGGFLPAANSGGFATAGGFAGAAGGGFTSVASTGGGFAAAAKGGGFSSLASGGGFAGAAAGGDFGAIAPSSSFAEIGTAGGGFGGAGTGAGFASGGFAAFGSNQGGGFSGFGANTAAGAGKPPAELLTKMRK